MARHRKDAFSPSPPATDPVVELDTPPVEGGDDTPPVEPKLYKFQVRNSFVQVDGSIRAESPEAGEEAVTGWLVANLTVREA